MAELTRRNNAKNNTNSTIIATTAADGIEFIPIHKYNPTDNIHSTPIIEHNATDDVLVHSIHEQNPADDILSTPIPEPKIPDVCGIPILETDIADIYNTKRRTEPAEKKERKTNTMTYPEIAAKLKNDGFKKVGTDEWVHPDKKGGYEDGKIQRVTLDRLHGELEGYDRSGKVHQGAIDPATGKIYKPAVPGRDIRK